MTDRPAKMNILGAYASEDFEAVSGIVREQNLKPRPSRNIAKFLDETPNPGFLLSRQYQVADQIIAAALEWEKGSPAQRREEWLGDEEIRSEAMRIASQSWTVSTSKLKTSKKALTKFRASITSIELSLEDLDEYARLLDYPEIESHDNPSYPRTLEGRIINQVGPMTALSSALEILKMRTAARLAGIDGQLASRNTGRGAPRLEGKVSISEKLGWFYYELSREVPTISYESQDRIPSYYGRFAPVLADVFKILGWSDLTDHYIRIAKEHVESRLEAQGQIHSRD
ncbi:hypothetical protein EU803_07565 [Loktanella sp. IMCC34160]|uniref:hypothetical protein n=1 Tax=Loktanella sp. IMCC34160 TaxID=2510646 RepID=UPI00101D8CAD|nr:hypothetical protein [Loktanella sp. IMCC34160]RYG92282.1 hypothetical protein EU803_07565 [Loktanella sp. IMCC34160]